MALFILPGDHSRPAAQRRVLTAWSNYQRHWGRQPAAATDPGDPPSSHFAWCRRAPALCDIADSVCVMDAEGPCRADRGAAAAPGPASSPCQRREIVDRTAQAQPKTAADLAAVFARVRSTLTWDAPPSGLCQRCHVRPQQSALPAHSTDPRACPVP